MFKRTGFICRAIALFLMAGSVLYSCKSTNYTYAELPANQLIFGKGGGISGAVTTYTLLENGQIFSEKSLEKTTAELQKIKKNDAKKLFAELAELNFTEYEMNHPGNVYYFIQLKKDSLEHKIVWGDEAHPVKTELQGLYDRLNKHAR